MPLLSLPRDFLDTFGKIVGTGMADLVVGRTFCSYGTSILHLRSGIVTDVGTKRKIAISPDVLSDFFSSLLG